jgi:hypothetical protein
MFNFRTRPYRWFGPLGIAYAGYRGWRRHSHRQPVAMHPDPAEQQPSPPSEGQSHRIAERVATATAPSEEIVPGDLTSPGTVSDPELEERRAEEAAERERESRASSMTKFDELRQEEDLERAEHAALVAELAPPDDSR